MNYWLLIGYFLFSCVFCGAQSNQQFGISSATITYVHSGSVHGTSTLCFDDFGLKKATQTTIRKDSVNGEILTQYHEVFIDNVLLSEDNPDTRTETSLSNSIISSALTSEMLISLGFSESGKCAVADKICTEYISDTDTICLWNGIVLKASMHLSVITVNLEAVTINLKPPPNSVFQLISENINQ